MQLLHCNSPSRPSAGGINRVFSLSLQVPDLVELYQRGETMLDDYITHRLPFDGEGGCPAQGVLDARAGWVPGTAMPTC